MKLQNFTILKITFHWKEAEEYSINYYQKKQHTFLEEAQKTRNPGKRKNCKDVKRVESSNTKAKKNQTREAKGIENDAKPENKKAEKSFPSPK